MPNLSIITTNPYWVLFTIIILFGISSSLAIHIYQKSSEKWKTTNDIFDIIAKLAQVITLFITIVFGTFALDNIDLRLTKIDNKTLHKENKELTQTNFTLEKSNTELFSKVSNSTFQLQILNYQIKKAIQEKESLQNNIIKLNNELNNAHKSIIETEIEDTTLMIFTQLYSALNVNITLKVLSALLDRDLETPLMELRETDLKYIIKMIAIKNIMTLGLPHTRQIIDEFIIDVNENFPSKKISISIKLNNHHISATWNGKQHNYNIQDDKYITALIIINEITSEYYALASDYITHSTKRLQKKLSPLITKGNSLQPHKPQLSLQINQNSTSDIGVNQTSQLNASREELVKRWITNFLAGNSNSAR